MAEKAKKYKVREGFVFVTFDKRGDRIPNPNLTIVDTAIPAHAEAVADGRQMHKLEPLEPEKKAPAEKPEKVEKPEKKDKKKPERKKPANRPARRGASRR